MLRGVMCVQTNVSSLYLSSLLKCRLESVSSEIHDIKLHILKRG